MYLPSAGILIFISGNVDWTGDMIDIFLCDLQDQWEMNLELTKTIFLSI